jgi:hypothetical protein
MGDFREVTPGGKPLKRIYVAIMLWFVGRAIQAAAVVDDDVKKEFENLPDGPTMIVGKNRRGKVKYLGWNPKGRLIDLQMKIKSLEAAILMFTFQESTAVANARVRMIVDGEVPPACAIVRVLDIVEVYLLAKIIAKLAVKRYPVWSFGRKWIGRTRIYVRAVLGY